MRAMHTFLLLLTLVIVLFWQTRYQGTQLKTGDISFIGFNAIENDSFSIVSFVDIAPHSSIRFTDSEWDGTRFDLDENCMTWNSGENWIKAGTVVHFSREGNQALVSVGMVDRPIRLSRNEDAVFAYVGTEYLPNHFLAAMANSESAYGTLENTGLTNGKTALTFPEGTYSAQYLWAKIDELDSKLVYLLSNYHLKIITAPIS